MIGDWGPDVLFGQVREDAAVEVAALATCERAQSVMCIGSAGCTAFSLLSLHPDRLSIVDVNVAQCMLLELKKTALQQICQQDPLVHFLDVDARPVYDDVRPHLAPGVRAFWDRRRSRLRLGLNHCGHVDRRLGWAMGLFRRAVPMPSLVPERENWRWRAAFSIGLSRPILRLAYTPSFLQGLPADFPTLMRHHVQAAFDAAPPNQNPYVSQTFLGRYASSTDAALPIYIQRRHLRAVRARLEHTQIIQAEAADWLEQQPAASLDFCALSNIMEVTPSEYATRLWNAVARASRPGALLCTRSIFPRHVHQPITPHGRFTYEVELSESLARRDRSPFCRFIQVHRMEA